MTRTTWLILGLIVAALVAVVIEWCRERRAAVPAAVKAVRDFYPEPKYTDDRGAVERAAAVVDATVVAVGVASVPVNTGQGATAAWSPAAELAAVGDGELLPAGIPTVSIDDIPDAELIRPGTPTVSIDDLTDEQLWEASFGADLRRLDNALEEARRLCTANLAAAGLPLQLMQELDRRDLDAHERAVDHATVLTTSDFPAAVAVTARPRKPECGPRARRDRKRANRALGR